LPEVIKEHLPIREKEFFRFLKQKIGMLEGVCIGGGEPTINKELPKFCQKIKRMGYLIKLDTNGSNPQMLKELIEKRLIDYVAMDIKAPKDKYEELIGLKGCSPYYLLNNIEESINILKEGKIDYEFRTTVIPCLKKEDILKIAHWIAPCKRYFLQNFRPKKTINPAFRKLKPHSREYLFEIKNAIAPLFEVCEVRE